MRLAVIAPTYLPARRANTVQVMKMAQALKSIGHDVRVCVPGYRPQIEWGELARHYGLDVQFPVEWLPVNPLLRGYDYGFKSTRWAAGWGAEIIYTRLPQAAAIASMRALRTIFEIHDMPGGVMGPFMLKLFLRGRGGIRLVAITHALAADLSQGFDISPERELIMVAADGVDVERYQNLPTPAQARQTLNIKEGFTVVYSGHLYRGRGVGLILALAEALPEINFLLVGGDPNDVERVRDQTELHGLTNITLTGFVPNADLPLYQAAADVFVMPYQQEVSASSGGDIARYFSPMKLFEYLACGRVILSSDLPVLREVLSPDTAILLPGEDVGSWVMALTELHQNPESGRDLAHRARELAQHYTWKARSSDILSGIAD